jgi:hypothetical protein
MSRRSPLLKNYGHIYRTHLLKRASNKYLKREREREKEKEDNCLIRAISKLSITSFIEGSTPIIYPNPIMPCQGCLLGEWVLRVKNNGPLFHHVKTYLKFFWCSWRVPYEYM